MTTLFIVCGALILAVIGRAILEPLPSRDQGPAEAQAVAEERAQVMQGIAMSVF